MSKRKWNGTNPQGIQLRTKAISVIGYGSCAQAPRPEIWLYARTILEAERSLLEIDRLEDPELRQRHQVHQLLGVTPRQSTNTKVYHTASGLSSWS
jgi:hypothetical protein